ncbi:MAG: hypothetical protein H7Y13_14075 [Sphingobacteriaceae bacterium]|nr:hypothetical protein [Sphingobacteriaceae bacterium]
MTGIDRNSALKSLELALVPLPDLIDGRTECDKLSFLTNFATLINFYDSENNKNGNWAPFLLKDPVFLLAQISQTNFENVYAIYHTSTLRVEALLNQNNNNSTNLAIHLNRLFNQITNVFIKIERWAWFMQQSDQHYELRSFLLHQVKKTYSVYFWALQSLREAVLNSKTLPGVEPVRFYSFANFDEKIWNENKDKSPYWEILGYKITAADQKNTLEQQASITAANASACFNALILLGDKVFGFLHQIIHHASSEYEKIKDLKSPFPDTTLLRTFVDLTKIHQEQLNAISQKHLDFYYTDILKQGELPGSPDTAILCAELAKQTDTFRLAAGTLFNAGFDLQKNTVLFRATEDVSLNPASIASVKTLATSETGAFYLQQAAKVDTITKDENGNVLSWPTFGIDGGEPTTNLNTGIAFASPMLYLKEGQRDIYLTLTCIPATNVIDKFTNAQYFLSTSKAWIPVTGTISPYNSPLPDSLVIHFGLKPGDPAIEPFLKNPDGLITEWPLLKIVFNVLPNPADVPVINTLRIQVNVTGLSTFQFSNDLGPLSTKGPFPPFGPTPLVNSRFIIGNAEIFSKPFSWLHLELNWDTVPANFQTYYQQYNNYLSQLSPVIGEPVKPAPVADKGFFAGLKKFGSKIWNGIKNIFSTIKKVITAIIKLPFKLIEAIAKWLFTKESCDCVKDQPGPFNNVCFRVNFGILQQQVWQTLTMSKMKTVIAGNGSKTFMPYTDDTTCKPAAQAKPNTLLLFDTSEVIQTDPVTGKQEAIPCVTGQNSCFEYGTAPQVPVLVASGSSSVPSALQNIVPDPGIQNQTETYSTTSASGFLKMTLTDPTYGFGSSVYSNVVSYIALKNGIYISRKCPASKLIAQAGVPFAPKLLTFSASYSAIQTYNLFETGEYPLQCFMYTPFSTQIVYDNQVVPNQNNQQPVTGLPIKPATETENKQDIDQGIPLFPSFGFNGALFIELKQLIPANTLNLYFELARNYTDSTLSREVSFYYLADNGWNPLKVFSDGTNSFSCSGIIKLDIPGDITNAGTLMPGTNYWISIAVNGDLVSFSGTVYLKTNGFEVQRSGSAFLSDNDVPQIPAGTITKSQTAIPQIAAIIQPFASYGGKALETKSLVNKRVSNRIKTKDRAVSSDDYFRLINQEFTDVYYSKPIYNIALNSTNVYLVKAVTSPADVNAFVPLVTECLETKVQKYLQDRSSAFTAITISQFDFYYLIVNTEIEIKSSYSFESVAKQLNQALMVYLSPWISSGSVQINIDQPIISAQVADFIRNQEGVLSVQNISFQSPSTNIKGDKQVIVTADTAAFDSGLAGALFIPAIQHNIKLAS